VPGAAGSRRRPRSAAAHALAAPHALAAALALALALALAAALALAVVPIGAASAPTRAASAGARAVQGGRPGADSRRPATVGRGAPLLWRACDTRFRCARLSVPVDYAAPARGRLALSVVELPATGPHPVGDLVMNPGGPGASGVQFLEQTTFPTALRRSFTLVSFDPRGVGASDPVRCVDAAGIRRLVALDPAPATPSTIAGVARAARAFDAACAAHTPRLLLENVGSAATVEDMDALRAALGEARLDYLGFSYGTYLGELYAERYPTHVRAMVLDGALDPALSSTASDLQQAVGFESDLRDFFSWCATTTTCTRELPAGARTAYGELDAGLRAGRRLDATLKARYGGVQRVTLGVFETAVAGALYSDQTWPVLAQAMQQALAGSGSILAAIAYSYEGLMPNGQFSNQLAANTAVNCLDRPSPTSLSTYERLAAEMARVAPDFGASSAWGSLPCAYWPVPAEGTPAPIHAPGSPPILVIGSTGDPATPYVWAEAVARELDRAVLLTRTGPGHTGYLFSACIQKWTNRYLTTLAMPPPATRCASSS